MNSACFSMSAHVLSFDRTPYFPGPTPRSYQCQNSVPARRPRREPATSNPAAGTRRARPAAASFVFAVLSRIVPVDDLAELLENERFFDLYRLVRVPRVFLDVLLESRPS